MVIRKEQIKENCFFGKTCFPKFQNVGKSFFGKTSFPQKNSFFNLFGPGIRSMSFRRKGWSFLDAASRNVDTPTGLFKSTSKTPEQCPTGNLISKFRLTSSANEFSFFWNNDWLTNFCKDEFLSSNNTSKFPSRQTTTFSSQKRVKSRQSDCWVQHQLPGDYEDWCFYPGEPEAEIDTQKLYKLRGTNRQEQSRGPKKSRTCSSRRQDAQTLCKKSGQKHSRMLI